jgi:hypothetical protein
MAAAGVHPRRTQKATGPRLALSVEPPTMTLRKSGTFSARTGISSELCSPIDNAAFMPKRSPTCPLSLEDLVIKEEDCISARQSDVAKLLKRFDDKLRGYSSDDADASILNEQNVLAVPQFVLDHQEFDPDSMDVDVKSATVVNHHHDSDSGIGSSVESACQGRTLSLTAASLLLTNTIEEHRSRNSTRASVKSISTTHSAITKSFSSTGSTHNKKGYHLSKDAVQHIERLIVKPILDEPSLKEFHPLIEDIPRRIGAKFISNLRDLEKTLLFLAPVSFKSYLSACAVAYYHGRDVKDFSSSPSSFLEFCESSIECLHTTVDHLSERDQRLPTDRPYTNNYFLDLVEQIRRYAQIMARTREREANGEALDEMDYSRYVAIPAQHGPPNPMHMTHVLALSHPSPLLNPNRLESFESRMKSLTNSSVYSDEEIVLEGGLSNNGRPAELVRKKNGKAIPLNPESSRSAPEGAMSSKRPLSDDEYDEDDDDILRSMARRRKSDKAGDVAQVCAVCRKEFKRPCDLTKHEKTHSRPWKCSEPKCRYHDMGWPTEKERDRHVNDKHSAAPRMYRCKFPPCTYMSKRESNCKQHMEKAHNWQYVRSKSNGRKKGDSTDASSVHRTPSTPLTPFMATPASANQTMATPDSAFAPSPWMPTENAFGFGDARMTPAQSLNGFENGARRVSVTTAGSAMTYSSGFSPELGQSSLLDNTSPVGNLDFNSPIFGGNGGMDYNFSTNFQQPTPALSIGADFSTGADFSFNAPLDVNSTNFEISNNHHLSPTGQGDLTLYSPHMDTLHADEGFGEAMGFGQDFTLYESTTNSTMPNATASWFPDMNIVGGQFDHFGFENPMFPQ